MSLLRQAEQCLLNQKTHSNLNAFISPFFRQSTQRWIDRLHEAQVRKEDGTQLSAIDGQLIAVKDNICTTDFPTTCASGILKRFTSPYNAAVVELLEDAGAIVAGKTNLDEFGMGSHSTHSYFGPVINQLGLPAAQFSAGGSSGGSAVAVMTGQCAAALGTDTGGSVRLPAAYTGILGFKPSYGLISRWGVVAYANSLDTVGILGGTCETVRNTFGKVPFAIGIQTEILEANLTMGKGILNQYDARDPTSLPSQSRSRILELISNHRREGPLRIGVPIEYNIQELSPTVKQTWESTIKTLKSQGHSIHPVSLPATRQALSAYYVLAPAEASSNLAKYDGIRYGTRAKAPTDSEAGYLYAQTRGEGFGDEVRRRILLGAFSLSAEAMDNYFIQAQKVRRLVQADFDGAFRLPNPLQTEGKGDGTGVDVLICPTAPSVPPTLESLRDSSPIDAYMNDVFTVPASLAGLPAMSVPVAVECEAQRVDGVNTVGIQVIGQYGDDDLVLRIGEVIEENNART